MRAAGAAGTVRSKVNHNLNAEEQPVTHQPADCDQWHDSGTDQTYCYPLDDDHAAVAHILGHDVHRRGHVRLTPAERAQIAELVGWAKSQACDSSPLSAPVTAARGLQGLPVTPRDDSTLREAI